MGNIGATESALHDHLDQIDREYADLALAEAVQREERLLQHITYLRGLLEDATIWATNITSLSPMYTTMPQWWIKAKELEFGKMGGFEKTAQNEEKTENRR